MTQAKITNKKTGKSETKPLWYVRMEILNGYPFKQLLLDTEGQVVFNDLLIEKI